MDRETATVIEAPAGADLIDFAEVKRRPRKPRPEPTPDELLEELPRAVRRTLLADLTTWPEAFQRALRDRIEHDTEGHFAVAGILWNDYRAARELDDAAEEPAPRNGCGCGCRGFNGMVAQQINKLREAAREPRPRSGSAFWVQKEADELLYLLWLHGRRRIDRARLRQHAVESVAAEVKQIENGAVYWQQIIARPRARLRDGYAKGPRKGQPLDAKDRASARGWLQRVTAARREERAKLAKTRALLADEAALVRHWTGCERVAAGVS